VQAGPLLLNKALLIGAVLTVVTIEALHRFFTRTRAGLRLAAVAEDHVTALSLGVSVRQATAIAWMLGTALAMLASMVLLSGTVLGLQAAEIGLRALPVGLSPFHFRVRAFEVCLRPFAFSLRTFEICLRPRPLGRDRFVQLTAGLKGQFGSRLLGFLPDAQGLGDHRALDIGAGRREFGLEARGPLPADLLELRRPALFGVRLGVPPRFPHCQFVGLGEPPQMGLELSVQTRANVVDDGTERILGHSLALSGEGSGKSSSENAASPRPPAT